MLNPRDRALLTDIANAAKRIVEFAEGMDENSFRLDLRTNLAIQHQLMVIGEATKLLSHDVRVTIGGIPWNSIARMRDRLIHGYDTVNLIAIWDTAVNDIPVLLKAVSQCHASDGRP